MRRARGQDGKRLFAVDDFLTAQQIFVYGRQDGECHRGRGRQEERKNLILDVTAEIKERLVAEEE